MGTLDAYADMKLENGDKLSVEANSSLVLNLDDDKYAMLESGTRLTLEASGTKETSRTCLLYTSSRFLFVKSKGVLYCSYIRFCFRVDTFKDISATVSLYRIIGLISYE